MSATDRYGNLDMNWRSRLSANPAVCHGDVCIAGTRVPASVVLDNLAAGLSPEAIVASYPSLRLEDVHAVLDWVAEIAREGAFLPAPRAG